MSVRRGLRFRTLVSLLALAVVVLAAQAGQRWWP
jgi:hypothetical protein